MEELQTLIDGNSELKKEFGSIVEDMALKINEIFNRDIDRNSCVNLDPLFLPCWTKPPKLRI